MSRFAFLILNYNTKSETENCVKSIELLNREGDEIEIVIVDNNSNDGSVDEFNTLYQNKDYIHVIQNTVNEGFSRGNNLGYRYVCNKILPDFLIMINSDIECRQKELLANIKNIYDEKHFSVLGPDVYAFHMKIHQSPIGQKLPNLKSQEKELNSYQKMLEECYQKQRDGKTRISRFSGKAIEEFVYKYGKRLHLDRLKKDALLYNKRYENVILHGAALIFSKAYMEKYRHALYPEPFYYGEEDLLYLKCNRNKDIILYDPRIKVWHAEGVSAQKSKGKKYTVQREIFQYENYVKSKELLIKTMKDSCFFENELRDK